MPTGLEVQLGYPEYPNTLATKAENLKMCVLYVCMYVSEVPNGTSYASQVLSVPLISIEN